MDLKIKNYEDLLMNYFLFKESNHSVYEDWCPYHYLVRKGSVISPLGRKYIDELARYKDKALL